MRFALRQMIVLMLVVIEEARHSSSGAHILHDKGGRRVFLEQVRVAKNHGAQTRLHLLSATRGLLFRIARGRPTSDAFALCFLRS